MACHFVSYNNIGCFWVTIMPKIIPETSLDPQTSELAVYWNFSTSKFNPSGLKILFTLINYHLSPVPECDGSGFGASPALSVSHVPPQVQETGGCGWNSTCLAAAACSSHPPIIMTIVLQFFCFSRSFCDIIIIIILLHYNKWNFLRIRLVVENTPMMKVKAGLRI